MQGFDDHCHGSHCNNTSVTGHHQTQTLSNLRIYTTYQIQVQAIHITAKDGTVVTIPYGNYSEAINETTDEGVPSGPPEDVKAEPNTPTSIIIKWKKVDECKRNGKITKYVVEVYNSSLDELKWFNVSGSTYQVIVPDLQYANYSAKVQAITAVGDGPFSEYQTTTPHQPAPHIVPGNVSAEATGNSTIRVKWSATDIPSNIGFRGFSIKYEAVEHLGKDTVDGEIYEKTLTGLRMFTKYNIQVAARTTQDGNYSETVFATTLEGVPTAPPSNIVAEILESTFVGISWGPVPEKSRNGEIRGYRVIYYRVDNDTNPQSKTVTGGDFYSSKLRSLGKFSKYHVKVLAFTRAGNGVADDITFRTSDDVPSKAPGKLTTYSRISPHSIRVSWKPVLPKFMNGILISYRVTYKRVRIGDVIKEYEPVKKAIVGPLETTVMLANLEPYSKYEITIAAKTVKGFGPSASFVYGETCHCEKRLTTSWRRYEPYVNFTEDGRPAQIIPVVLQAMVKECCGQCAEHNQTILDFKTNGRNKSSFRNTSRELLANLDEYTDFTFPVYGHKDQDTYKGGYGYIPVIESAGVAFIVYPEFSTTQMTMFRSLIRCLPVLLLPIVTAYIAGVIIWFLVSGAQLLISFDRQLSSSLNLFKCS
ncbi:hypothetical protein OS493_022560 [Desmophyllum pertusum]|uniref:Fibronectin type-III domain-containing protein n=1 Tax=Desmophyllum pertusum TaxID=174260 RepID=A0A9W9ZBC8_9CNID|nr:hypothetical protein OS493_022560 [Desmophyllum pertusum]